MKIPVFWTIFGINVVAKEDSKHTNDKLKQEVKEYASDLPFTSTQEIIE